MVDVNDKGEVKVSGKLIGRLDGFRFRQDVSSSPDEARTLRQSVEAVLKPAFHLRADRFYNAPDTEIDITEQGGLMWGSTVVGKLVKGPEITRPLVEPFVDEEAGSEVTEKVRRRLHHFIYRKVAQHFGPLVAMGRDETLVGLARAVAFRLIEALGVLPRDEVSNDVKNLDHDAQGVLRKHGVNFGQFTIFVDPLLDAMPTRLRLVLWSLYNGLQEFPESPQPSPVSIPNLPYVPKIHYILAGYHPVGAHAIRIDILERLADLVQSNDSRNAFEVSPEMLSITGMTQEQFSELMIEVGYAGLLDHDRPFLFAGVLPKESDKNGPSASEQISDEKKPLGLGGSPRSEQVKQSFSHGRTKAVVVETKRKRVVVPTKSDAAGAAAATDGGPRLGDPTKRPVGISDAEMEHRLTALRAARAREADKEATRQAVQPASHLREAGGSSRSEAEENPQDKRIRADIENRSSSKIDPDNPFAALLNQKAEFESAREDNRNGTSASNHISDGKKPLGLGGSPRSGQVRQSFSHGRTKAVVVETKRKRVVVPTKSDAAGAAAAKGGDSRLDNPTNRPAGISDDEMERRLSALKVARAREQEDSAKRVAYEKEHMVERQHQREAETRAKAEEMARARADAEEEARVRAKAEEEADRKSERVKNLEDLRAAKEQNELIRPQPDIRASQPDEVRTQASPYSLGTSKPSRHALLIGISEYDDLDDLGYARKDAEDVASALVKHCGFNDLDVELMTCKKPKRTRATKQYIKQALVDLEDAKGADLFVFGFWGHGIAQNHGDLHLTTADTNKSDFIGTSISLDFIVGCIKSMQAKNTLIILDCCQSQPWALGRDAVTGLNQDAVDSIRNAATRLVSFDDGPEEQFEYRASAIFSACQLGERAYESRSMQNGYFTAYLLEALSRGHTRVTDISQYVSRSTHRAVKKEMGSIQRPWLELKGNSDIELSAKSRRHFD